LLGVIYRSQIEINFCETFSTVLHDLLEPLNKGRNPCEIICVGDLNYDQFKTNKSDWKELEKTMGIFNMQQIITKPTRVTKDTSTCIDHIWTNRPHMYNNRDVAICNLSDHRLIYASRKSIKIQRETKIIEARSYRQFDENAFVTDLTDMCWDSVVLANSPDEGWDRFLELFLSVCDKHAPVKKIKISNQQPAWITDEYLDLRGQSQKAREKAEKSKSSDDWREAKLLRNKVNNLRNKLKANDLHQQINENRSDPRRLWQTLKTLLPGKSHSDIPAVKTESGMVNGEQEVANAMNMFFSTVGENLAKIDTETEKCCSAPNSNVDSTCTFTFVPITEDQVFKSLASLDTRKATGLDGVSSRLIKAGAGPLTSPLTKLFNRSLSSGSIPQQWKMSRVTPLYKDGAHTEVNNYRPISVIPVVMKIFERLVHDQLYSHLSTNNLLSSNQSGFRPKHSTLTTLIDVTDYVLQNIDAGHLIGGIFIDLKKRSIQSAIQS